LKPDSTSDGEEDIDYILKFNLQGSIDPKLNLTTEVSTFTENEVYNIIAPEQASIKLDSPSDFQVDINLSVDDDVFRMAGNYADTITITYEDL
jgi:hypothetical protein